MPPTPTSMGIAQELRDRLSLQLLPTLVVSERTEQQPDGSVVYVVESSDEAMLSEAVRQAGLLLRGQYPDAKVEAVGESVPPNYRATMTVSAPAQPVTASRYADVVDTIPVALQVGEHIYGIASDSKYQVLRDGETVAEAASPAEAFGMLFGLARQDLWETLHPADDPSDVTLLNLDHDFIAGLLPSLLDSPAVQGRAADELIKFFEMATLQVDPEPPAETVESLV